MVEGVTRILVGAKPVALVMEKVVAVVWGATERVDNAKEKEKAVCVGSGR